MPSKSSVIDRYWQEIGLHEVLPKKEELRYAREFRTARAQLVSSAYRLSPQLRRFALPNGFRGHRRSDAWTYFQVHHVAERCRIALTEGGLSTSDTKRCAAVRAAWHRMLKAREVLITHNLRIAFSIATTYQGAGLSLPELVQESNLGLTIAVDKFDPSRNLRFATYARWWIRQCIGRALTNTSRLVRLPPGIVEALRLYRKNGREHFHDGKLTIRGTTLGAKSFKMLDMINHRPVSLDAARFEESPDSSLYAILPSDAEGPEETLIRESCTSVIARAIEQLEDPRERTIIQMRFGIGYPRQYTLDEIGEIYALSRERIRQLERIALKRMRRGPESRALRELVS